MVQDINATFRLTRTVVFSIVSLFSFIVLALSASITNWTSSYFGSYFSFAALGIATALLTLFTLPVMLFLSLNRKGAVTSMVAIEVGWTSFLWILWLSVGGNSLIWGGCGYLYYSGGFDSICAQIQAVSAFGFLTWIMLLMYNISLFSLLIRQHMRGNTTVWTGYITEADFAATGANSTVYVPKGGEGQFAPQYLAPVATPGYPAQPGYPVQQQGPQPTGPYPQV